MASHKSTISKVRTTLNLRESTFNKMSDIRAAILKQTHHNMSMSQLVDILLIAACADYEDKAIANTVILESKRKRF
jgi:hypothetical protein